MALLGVSVTGIVPARPGGPGPFNQPPAFEYPLHRYGHAPSKVFDAWNRAGVHRGNCSHPPLVVPYGTTSNVTYIVAGADTAGEGYGVRVPDGAPRPVSDLVWRL